MILTPTSVYVDYCSPDPYPKVTVEFAAMPDACKEDGKVEKAIIPEIGLVEVPCIPLLEGGE